MGSLALSGTPVKTDRSRGKTVTTVLSFLSSDLRLPHNAFTVSNNDKTRTTAVLFDARRDFKSLVVFWQRAQSETSGIISPEYYRDS